MFTIIRHLRTLCFVGLLVAFAVPAPAQTIKTVAGGGPNNIPALSAGISSPRAMALDASGNYYLVSKYKVLRVDGNGQVSVYAGNGLGGFSGDGGLATAAELEFEPQGLALDSAGNLFIADTGNVRVRRVDAATHVITTVAGNGVVGNGGDGGPATSAELIYPSGVAVDNAGNLFIASAETSTIRRVDATTRLITTFAHVGVNGISIDSAGNLFVSDESGELVRRVDAATGAITTIAGNGFRDPLGDGGYSGDGGPATAAELNAPTGVAVDGAGNLLIADTFNNRIRRVDAATGVITTVAGNGTEGFSGDGGPATSAQLDVPTSVAVDSTGNLFISDVLENRIRRVDAATHVIATTAGNGTESFGGDGGPATSAQIDGPTGVAVDSAGNVFIADQNNIRIRRVDAVTGVITTFAGNGALGFSGDGGPATSAELRGLFGVALDNRGNLFIGDFANERIRRVDAATGIIATAAGNGLNGYSGDGGLATSAEFNVPIGVAVDSHGNVFIADSDNQVVRRVDAATGVITTFAGNGYHDPSDPYGLVGGFSGDGGLATSAELNGPFGVAVDGAGNLFIADTGNNRVRRVDASSHVITTVAGNGTGGFSGDGGPATSAELGGPTGVAIDSAGNLFIADVDNERIRRVDAATQIITTVAGSGTFGFNGDDRMATSAEFAGPASVAVDSAGNLFIGDRVNNRVREVVMNSHGPQSQTISLAPLANRTFEPGDSFTVLATASSGLPVTLTVGPTDNCTISRMTVLITGAGSCTVTAHQDGNSSFNAAPDVSQTFSIAKATAAIHWGNLTATYNGKPQSATATTTPSGLGLSITYNSSSAAPSTAGSYTVVATVNDANYQGTASATLTIKPAPLAITANNMTMILDAAMPAFAASYSGFVNGEDASALSGTLNCTTTAAAASRVGSYPITCDGQSSPNYAISYAPGTLRVLYAPAGQACYNNSGHTILPPINANGTSVWHQGRTVPAKFRVCDANSVSIGTSGVVAGFYLIGIASGTVNTSVNDAVSSTTPDTQFRWDATNQQWIFNISTKGLSAGNTYVYQILLNDGTTIVFQFGLRQE